MHAEGWMSKVVQHLVGLECGMWPSQSSSKWWRLWGVLWGFGAERESLSQAYRLSQGGTFFHSVAAAPRLPCAALLWAPAGLCFQKGGGGRGIALHELRWEYQASSFPAGWERRTTSASKRQDQTHNEFSSGFHFVSVGVKFIYAMMQQSDVQFVQISVERISLPKRFLLTQALRFHEHVFMTS